MGTTTNLTLSLSTDIYSLPKRELCFSKEAILRVDEK